MNKIISCIAVLVLLTACALTPEQKAKQIEAQKRAEQDLQVQLAAQCDMETAQLLKQQFEQAHFTNEQERQDFRIRYVEKVNDPLFQSCYRLAWQNYINEQRLSRLERYYDWDRRFVPWWRPYWW